MRLLLFLLLHNLLNDKTNFRFHCSVSCANAVHVARSLDVLFTEGLSCYERSQDSSPHAATSYKTELHSHVRPRRTVYSSQQVHIFNVLLGIAAI
jgi:hypothetical protein